MTFQENENGIQQKKKYQGDWTCSKCGKKITELPFQPAPDRLNELDCYECHKAKRESSQ